MITPPNRDLRDYERAYAESPFEAVQARFRKRCLLEVLARHAPRRILEVGCGRETLALSWRTAERFVVIEPAPQFAAEARRATADLSNVTVIEDTIEGAAHALPPGDDPQAFDAVLLSGLLHELADPDAVMTRIQALCGPGTLLHVNVPNARSLHRLLALEMGLIDDLTTLSERQQRLQQSRTFTLETLSAYVAGFGFEVVESGSYFVKPFTHSQMQALQGIGLLTDAMLEGLWGLAKHLPDYGSEIYVNLR